MQHAARTRLPSQALSLSLVFLRRIAGLFNQEDGNSGHGGMLHCAVATKLLLVAPARHAYSVSLLVHDTTQHSL